jgi:hypothetical protein
MKRHAPPEYTARAVALALFLFAGLTAGAWLSGALALFDRVELASLAGFAAGFALLTYLADRQVRALIDRAVARLRGRIARRARVSRPARVT